MISSLKITTVSTTNRSRGSCGWLLCVAVRLAVAFGVAALSNSRCFPCGWCRFRHPSACRTCHRTAFWWLADSSASSFAGADRGRSCSLKTSKYPVGTNPSTMTWQECPVSMADVFIAAILAWQRRFRRSGRSRSSRTVFRCGYATALVQGCCDALGRPAVGIPAEDFLHEGKPSRPIWHSLSSLPMVKPSGCTPYVVLALEGVFRAHRATFRASSAE